MQSDNYNLGKQHYWEGLPVTAMDTAEPGHKIAWLSGWLDAKLEHKFIRQKSRSLNAKHAKI